MANGQREPLLAPPTPKPAGPDPEPAPVLFRTPTIEPRQLDNARLEAEIEAVRARVSGSAPMAADVEYLRALEEERLRRVGLGQVWLGRPQRSAAQLYQLVPMGDRIAVVEIDAAVVANPFLTAGTVVVTAEQLQQQLDKHGIETIDQAALAGMRASRVHVPGFESRLPGLFAQPVSGAQHLRTGFSGAVGELSASMGWSRGLFAGDLNVRPWGPQQQLGNFPIFDIQSFFGLTQVKTSTQAQQAGRFGVFTSGYEDITGLGSARRQALLGVAAADLFPGLPVADAVQLARTQAVLAVNADDVREFRERIGTSVQQRPTDYRSFLDSLLVDSPETVGNRRFTSLAQIEGAQAAGTLTVQDRARLLVRLSNRAAERVVSHGLTTSELVNLQRARAQFGLGAASAPPEVIATQVSPEFLMAQRAGGGWAGQMEAARRSAGRGGAGGATVAIVVDLGGAMFDAREHPDLFWEVVEHGGLGYASGAAGATAESIWSTQVSRAAINRGVAGSGFSVARGAGGGGVGGAIAAPIFVLGEMALSDEDYSGEDYFGKGTRAAVSGGGSGILAAGLTGALFGSEVPVAGNIIGFVIGVGAYIVIDSSIGDAVETAAREVYSGFGSVFAPVGFGSTFFATELVRRRLEEIRKAQEAR